MLNLLNKSYFNALTRNYQRVAICMDVIARLNAEKILPHSGNFFNNRNIIAGYTRLTVQESINTNTCEVCAKGALFCSWVGNFNNVEREGLERVSEVADDLTRVVPELVAIFGQEMLDQIEAAFEGETYCWHYDQYATRQYAKAFDGFDLKHIMQYIIDNRGEFPLPVDYNPYI
jgi:hypothetical protein